MSHTVSEITLVVMTNDITQIPEKRCTNRVTPDPDRPVDVQLVDQDYTLVTSAINLSIEGIGICVLRGILDTNIDNLSKIQVTLPEPVDYSFTTTVRIVHQQGGNFGAQFEDIAQEDAKKLHSYIESRLKKLDADALLKIVDEE